MELLDWLSLPVSLPYLVGITLAILLWRRLPTVSLIAFMGCAALVGITFLSS
jgi:hypothetical protein